jgi:hypothetical protein
MAVTPELAELIEQEISELKKSDLRRLGCGMNKFLEDFSKTLAQTETDMAALVSAGFNESHMPRSRALLELLSITYGERRGLAPDTAGKRAYFDRLMVLANLDRKRLSVVCSHIVKTCGDKKTKIKYRKIAKGSGIVNTLNANIALVSLIGEYPELSSQIKPGGFAIDPAYCNEVTSRSLELLKLKGVVVEHGAAPSATVYRQNRLLTLSLNAMSEIKKFAHAAFFDNQKYYNNNYATYSRSRSRE